MSKNNPPNPTSLANNLVHTGTGDINYSNYVEPVGHTPCDDPQINSRNDGDYIPLPHQDQPDESTDSESNTSYTSTAVKQPQPALKTKISLKESNQIQATGPYQVPLSLRKQFKIICFSHCLKWLYYRFILLLWGANDERSVVGKSRGELIQVSVVRKKIATMKTTVDVTILILLLLMLSDHLQIFVDHFDADLVRLIIRNMERHLSSWIGWIKVVIIRLKNSFLLPWSCLCHWELREEAHSFGSRAGEHVGHWEHYEASRMERGHRSWRAARSRH